MENCKHLKVLGKGDPARMGDPTVVSRFLTDLVQRVGMCPMGEPVIREVPLEIEKLHREPFEDEGGVTGHLAAVSKPTQIVATVELTTSHAALHTWPLREEFHLDFYSCRFFDKETIITFIQEVFHTTRMKCTDVTHACVW